MGIRRSGMRCWAVILVATVPLILDLTGLTALAVAAPAEAHAGDTAAARRTARRRWALMKMDEMANERLRCRERFTVRRQIDECEAGYNRRYREYNEIYLEAARD